MNILIAGGGKVGSALTRHLSREDHDLTLIDPSAAVLSRVTDSYDVMTLQGNCAAMDVLLQADVEKADLLIAATNADEVNLLSCMTAHRINPRLHTIARIRNPEYTEQIVRMREAFALSLAVNPEKQAAEEITRLLRYPGFLKRDSFAKGRVEIVELKVDAGGPLCGQRLMDLPSAIGCRVLVCAVVREGQAIIPGGSFRLLAGDRIQVTAPGRQLSELLKKLGIITHKVERVLIAGGGRVSFYLAESLAAAGIRATIIDVDEARCRELAELLPDADLVCGDAGDQHFLEEEGLRNADALVTATGLDELNMITSMYGHVIGVPHVITKLSHVEGSRVLDGLPLGSIICPKELAAGTIVRYVRAMTNGNGSAVSVHFIADGLVEAIEFRLGADAPCLGVPLRNVRLRKNVLVASITRGLKSEIPGGDSAFAEGDTVVVVTDADTEIRTFADIFA